LLRYGWNYGLQKGFSRNLRSTELPPAVSPAGEVQDWKTLSRRTAADKESLHMEFERELHQASIHLRRRLKHKIKELNPEKSVTIV
jgi:hypothetical protein